MQYHVRQRQPDPHGKRPTRAAFLLVMRTSMLSNATPEVPAPPTPEPGPPTKKDPPPLRSVHTSNFPAILQGLDFCGPLAFIGLSQVRESAIFSGIAIAERPLAERCCGVGLDRDGHVNGLVHACLPGGSYGAAGPVCMQGIPFGRQDHGKRRTPITGRGTGRPCRCPGFRRACEGQGRTRGLTPLPVRGSPRHRGCCGARGQCRSAG